MLRRIQRTVSSQGKREEANHEIQAPFENVSFMCITRENFVRKHLIKVVRSRWFERFVILIILANCIMLAMYDPLDAKCLKWRCQLLEKLEKVVFFFFSAEMLAKMVAMGIHGPKGYFSDRWNILDFLIVVAGVVDISGPDGGDFLSIVRLSRVLRPLRAINRVPSIRILVTLLMDTIPMLGNVLLLKFLVFSIFGILGVQVWQGKLRNRCFPAPNASLPLAFNFTSKFYAPSSGDYLCSLPDDRGMQSCSEIFDDCIIKGFTTNTTCRIFGNYYTDCRQDGPNPYYDNMSFDNIAMAWIFIYQVVTSEGWSELMYLILDVNSKYSWIYFVVLITIGSFFVVNLSLVVITMQFSETKRREMQIIREQRRLHVTESQMSLISDFKIIWSKLFAPLAKCKRRKKSIHHFHHHEHFHITHHTIRCEKCNMFCGTTQPETVSSKEVSSDNGNSIPKVEISCFDDDIIQNSPLRRKLSVSCPSLFEIERTPERKFSGTSVRAIHRAKIEETQQQSLDKDARLNTEKKLDVLPQQKMYLTPRKENSTEHKTLTRKDSGTENKALTPQKENTVENKALTRKGSDVSNTLSIHAESVSSISIDKKQSPNHASLTTKTSLSLQVNGAGTQLKTEAYCEANASIAAKEGGKKKTAMFSAETKAANSVKLQTPVREKVCKTYSNGSYNSEVRSDDVSDIADTSSEALYGSMFDLRNADKYYVSVEPTFIQKFRMHCKNLSESRKFSHFIMLFIVLNTICMGLEHHNQPKKMTDILELLNLIFIWIFGFEVCVKLLGVGPKAYFKVGYNVFDCLIVVLSVAEILINDNKNSTIIVLRSLRLLRIFKLVRPMRHQMMVMIRTMSSVMTFFALLFLFMFTFAILGMHLFGGKFVFDGITSRSNFDSFSWAMATVFQILTQEDWNLVMYDGMRATETKWAALYFLALMTIGYYVLLNLLVAILVEGFTTPMEKRRMAKRIATMLLNKSNSRSYHSSTSGSSLPQTQRSISMPDIPDSPYISNQPNGIITFTESFLRARSRTMTKALSLRSISSIVASKKDYASGKLVAEKPKPGEPILVSARPRMSRSGSLNEPYYALDANTQDMLITRPASVTTTSEVKVCPCFKEKADWSLFILSPENRFRKLLQVISANKWFDYFILLLIFYSCVLLAMENPNIQQGSTKQRVIQTSMFVLTWLFSAEMIIKVLAHGLLFGRDPYLRKGWNILDGLLVVLSWVDFALFLTQTGSQTDAIKAFRVLRALRSLRPLRMIRRAPGLKLVVQTLLYSLKPIGNTVLIAAIFFIVFGILGVQLMKGTFYHCEGGAATVIDRNQCNATNGIWVNYQYNFDDLPSALMALFVVSTKDGWVDIMRRGTDAVGVDKQPQENHSSWLLLYFISFLLIGGFLVLNMIVGVVVENFQRCRELQGDKDNAKKALAKWRECARTKLVHESFLKNYSGSRLILYKICTHSYWHIGITIVILLNVICMAMEHYNMSATMSKFIYISNIVFTILYVLEALLQIIALGFKQYFKNKWYLFDFIVVVVSVLGIALEEIITKDFKINPSVVRGVRMLRVVRVLKLLKVAKGLQFLLDHVKETIPQVTNLALLFSLLFFIYSCLGIQLFGTIECSAATPCAGLGKHANFKDLGSSMLTLFRIATGDNWSGILKDTLRSNCDDSSGCTRNCCLSRYASPLFFITFVLLAQFVLVNIVIAVLMKHLRVTKLCKGNLVSNKNSMRKTSKKDSNPVEQSSEALSKWKLAAARRKARRDEQQELQASYVRTKRSTDGLDNIQLKQFRNRSEDEMEGHYNANNNNNHIETDHVVIHREVQGSVNVSHESPDDGSKDKSIEGNRSRKSLWRRNPSFKINIDTSPDNETEKKEDIMKYRIAENLKKNYALVPFVSVAKTTKPRLKEKGSNSDSFPRNDSDSFPRNDVELPGSKEEREQFIDDKNDCKIEIKDDVDDDQVESEDIDLSFVSDHYRTVDSRRTSSDYSSVSPRIDIEIQSDDDYDKKPVNNCADDSELELEDKSSRTDARRLSQGSSIHENPVFESDSCRSLSGSPALHIPDDFFETSSDEDQSVPPRIPDCVQCESSPEIPKNIKEHGMQMGVIKDNLLLAAAQELESTDSCESFEILSEIHDGNNETPKDNGSNESFAIVISEGCQCKVSRV